MEPDTMRAQTDMATPQQSAAERSRKRHTIAALVYFLYGLFYLFGAQYLTSMQATARGMSNPGLFFAIGACIAVLFPLLIYSRFAFALSLQWKPRAQRATLFINFTLLLGLLVVARVVALVQTGAYTRSFLHTMALLIAAVTAACLLWAGLSRAAWISRTAPEP